MEKITPVVLSPAELPDPGKYPIWCDLSWFQNCLNMTSSVEEHYHDLPEVYLWHEGKAAAIIDGQPVPMGYGTLAYTAAGGQHSYVPEGLHSNTGIVPRAYPGCRPGHLHIQETGETPTADSPSFIIHPEDNLFGAPMELPRHSFARHICCGRFTSGQTILERTPQSWLALLAREGGFNVKTESGLIVVEQDHLFISPPGACLKVVSASDSEVAMAEGWPGWCSRQARG